MQFPNSLEGVARALLESCDVELDPGYEGPKPDWYNADAEGGDVDLSAPVFNAGGEEWFEELSKVPCKHGFDSPFRNFWDSEFDLYETRIENDCERSEMDDEPISIYVQIFVPKSGEVEAILFVNHGRNEYTDKYHYLFKSGALDGRNWMVVLMDSRGQGESTGFWNYFPSFGAAACDVGVVMSKVASGLDNIPKFWFCHSTGCSIVLGGMSNPEMIPIEVEGYIMSSPLFEPRPPAASVCPSVDASWDIRTPFGYLQSWEHIFGYNETWNDCSGENFNLHDDAAFHHLLQEPEVKSCTEKGPPTLGFIRANCELSGDLSDSTDGATGTDFAASFSAPVRIWGTENDNNVLASTSKRWCSAAQDCVYREFEGTCQHEFLYSVALGEIFKSEMYAFMETLIDGMAETVKVDVNSDPIVYPTTFSAGARSSPPWGKGLLFPCVCFVNALLVFFGAREC